MNVENKYVFESSENNYAFETKAFTAVIQYAVRDNSINKEKQTIILEWLRDKRQAVEEKQLRSNNE